MVDINLSKSVRSNLSSLQTTAQLMNKTSDRLSTGNKVNSALDNPTNFFTASSLNSRAGDLNQLMDSMNNGIKTIEAADNGLSAITKTLESMQSTLRQARQDKSFETESFSIAEGLDNEDMLTFSGGAIVGEVSIALGTAAQEEVPGEGAIEAEASNATGTVAMADDAALQAFADSQITLTSGTNSVEFTVAADSTKEELLEALNAEGFTAEFDEDDNLVVSRGDGVAFTIGGTDVDALGLDAGEVDNGTEAVAGEGGTPAVPAASKSVDDLVREINNNDDLKGRIRASNDNGSLRIENLSTKSLTTEGVSAAGVIDGTSSAREDAIAGNTVRSDLHSQYNELRDQLDKLADDASFNGINLLRGDKLTITFNETGTSSIDIQAKDEEQLNSAKLGIFDIEADDLDSDTNIDDLLTDLKGALNDVRSQSSAFGSNLSVVQNRQDFTQKMINTLETGAGNLTLADMNQEAANMMALQTRQSLASSTLSMANAADQNVLQLLR